MEHNDNTNDSVLIRAYNEHANAMYNYVFAILKDHYLAEDAVSESFKKLIGKSYKIDIEHFYRARAFLCVVCKNVAIDMLGDRTDLNTKAELCEVLEVEDEKNTDPAEIIARRETLSRACEIIDDFEPKSKKIFTRRRIEEKSREAIAEEMGMSVEAVKKRLLRSTSTLKNKLDEEGLLDEQRQ